MKYDYAYHQYVLNNYLDQTKTHEVSNGPAPGPLVPGGHGAILGVLSGEYSKVVYPYINGDTSYGGPYGENAWDVQWPRDNYFILEIYFPIYDVDGNYQMPIKYNTPIGNNIDSVLVVSHTLSTSDVAVSVIDDSTKQIIMVGIEVTDDNTVTFDFGNDVPTTDQYKVTIIG